jgi:raffinose/stachyose/melibiose transport system permease protein
MTATQSGAAASTSGAAVLARNLAAPPARRRRKSLRTRIELAVLVLPALAMFVLFVLYPMVSAVLYSFYQWQGFGPLVNFVGLGNYVKALQDPVFLNGVGHNLLLVVLSLVLQLPVSIALALLLNGRIVGRSALRLLVFLPYVLSEAITAVIWLSLLQPGGAVDATLKAFGLGGAITDWLANPDIVFYTLFVVITWKYIGFGIILFLAGLSGVPEELREAAALDGANAWQITRRIVLPLLAPTIRIWVFLSVIGSLQLFDLVWIMTLGGPAGASTTMATYLIDRGFRRYQFGYGSAVAVILFILCFVFAVIYQRFALRRDTQGALTGRVE